MKILNLRFKNLNSLAGEWFIDFTDPAFVTDGIFAITGPTGAGKTTILDAICLALYGSTPRLSNVSKGSNEIMSRGAGECSSEVTIETPTGRYRSTWSQHRSRKKPNGELQNPKHEISNADSGEVLESSLRGVAEKVESLTGLDFSKFTRSVLLAQGQFAEFLKSRPSERSPILEQITHTEVYSQISIRVHEREREERCKLEALSAKVGQLDLLSSEQVATIQAELAALDVRIQSLNEKVAQLTAQADWKRNIQRLEAELVELEKEREKLQRELEEFAPQRERLKRAVIAAELDSEATRLSLLRNDRTKLEESLKADEIRFPELEKSCQMREEAATNAAGKRGLAQAKCTEFEAQRAEIESLDRKIKVAEEAVASIGSELQALEKTIADESTKQKQEQEKQKGIERKAKELEKYFVANAADEWLVDGLSGLEIQLSQLVTLKSSFGDHEKEIQVKRSKVKTLEREQESLQRDQQVAGKQLDAVADALKRTETTLQELLSRKTIAELRKELGELQRQREQALLVASFEDHRARLHQGEACPLCGALEHPFATDGVAPTSELEAKINEAEGLIVKAEKLELEIRTGGEKKSQAERALSDICTKAAAQVRLIEAESSSLAASEGALERTRQQRGELESVLAVRLRPLGVELIPSTDVDELQRILTDRQRAWKERKEQAGTLASEMNQVRETLVAANVRLEGWETQRLGLSERKVRNQDELQREIVTRKERFGDLDPAKEAERLAQALRSAEAAEKEADKILATERGKLVALERKIEEARASLDLKKAELLSEEASFQQKLAARAFVDEAAFNAARMLLEQRKELGEREASLSQREATLREKTRDRKAIFEQEKSKALVTEPLEELEKRIAEDKAEVEGLNQQKGAKQHVLQTNQQRANQASTLQQDLARQQVECLRWEKLHDLIGSSDGKKFRNFAQAITFERLIAHANQQLSKMTERYELVPDSGDPLELCVRDNDQAGEVRPTKNLSGGESFLVSLALALGLSQMASGRVRVDSLFLDEGFGTLDEATLETALSALADLRQTGKLIGLISHVSALNERIGTKIEVTKIGEGRSRLAGPGCSKG
jgi:exonuclease SbcC